MPRRYYRRRTVVVRPKKKWASNMAVGTLATSGSSSPIAVLVANSTQSSTPTPIILKVGNIKLQGDAVVQGPTTNLHPTLIVMVFYLPEGLNLEATTASTVAAQHPEWIMAWKMVDLGLGTSSDSASSAFSVSSRLKRNLNSGDKICIGYRFEGSTAGPIVRYTAQYWTCAN